MTRTYRTTELRTFRRCRRLYFYEYVENLRPVRHTPALWIGSLFHEGLEVWYATGDAQAAMQRLDTEILVAFGQQAELITDPEQERQLNEDADLVKAMLSWYIPEARRIDDFSVVATELYCEVPIPDTDLVMRFKIDGLVVDERGNAWILEHKTAKAILNDYSFLEMDEQATAYTWGIGEIAEGRGSWRDPDDQMQIAVPGQFPKPLGILYNYVRKSVPQSPQMNKDGTPSRSMRKGLHAGLYRDAIIEAFGELEPHASTVYAGILAKLDAKRWIHREKVYRSDDQIRIYLDERRRAINEMLAARDEGEAALYRNPTAACGTCSFFQLCMGEYHGLDMSPMREESYTQREDPDARDDEEEDDDTAEDDE